MIFHDVEQNTDEWLALRAGKLTGSNFGNIMANEGKAFGEPAKKLAMNIATERLTGSPVGGGYSNAHMERGHEQEPIARMTYEEETFSSIRNGGFFDCGEIGCSPDGIIDNGLIEIKSVIPNIHFATVKRQSFDPAYKWQLIGNLYHTEKDFIDFTSYCADFPDGKKLFICRLERPSFKDEFERLVTREAKFLELVKEYQEIILNSEYQVKL